MAKRKYPSELNTRTVRVNIGDWHWLNSLSRELDVTVAEAFHKVITGLDHKAESKPKPAQIPMRAFKVTTPAAQVTGMPAPAIRVTCTPVIRGIGTLAKVMAKSASVQLRVTVAGKENGHAQ